MKFKIEFGEKLLQHRRLYVGFIVFAIILVMMAFNFGSWLFLNQMGDNLEEELGYRLRSAATMTAQIIETQFEEASSDQLYFYFAELEQILNRVKTENQLQAVFLVNMVNNNYSVIADDDISTFTFPPQPRTYILQDSLSLQSAWDGVAMASELHIIEGAPFKSAYAPVINVDQEIMAVVVVEASVQYFESLNWFKRGLILLGMASIVVVALFSIFLYWAITLLLQSYEKMRRSERLALMGQMAASMAHEIRNPLGIMKGTADVLRELYDNPDKPNELFDFIPMEIKRLNRLVNDFLSFARGVNIEKSQGKLNKIVLQVASDLQREQNNSKIEIKTDIAENLSTLEFDEDAIHRVIYNLALNGVQAMENEGTLTLILKSVHTRGNNFQQIRIQDTGCGISGDPDRIFDPFFTTKTKGTGLGLAISRQIIEKHDGWIDVKSQAGTGTTISFFLPEIKNTESMQDIL